MNMKAHSPWRNQESLLGAILMLLAILVFIGVVNFKDTAEDYRALPPSFFPNILVGVMVVLSLALLVRGWRNAPSPIFKQSVRPSNVLRVFGLMVLLVVFIVLLQYVGFAISSFLFLLALQLVLAERRPVRLLVFAIGVTLVMYVVFVLLLRVPLPRGLLF